MTLQARNPLCRPGVAKGRLARTSRRSLPWPMRSPSRRIPSRLRCSALAATLTMARKMLNWHGSYSATKEELIQIIGLGAIADCINDGGLRKQPSITRIKQNTNLVLRFLKPFKERARSSV